MDDSYTKFPSIKCVDENSVPHSEFVKHFPEQGRRIYTDLRSFADDKTVLRNPHKGWFWHYIDNGFFRPQYREEHDPDDHLLDFPGLNHLYLRFDWGDIEKTEGKPDWSYIDGIMEKWSRFGYRFSLRICCYEGSPDVPYTTPAYVYKAGARGYRLPDGRIEPDYGDPVFLEKLGAFMELAGKKFNGDKRIELVDVGTYGTWGEGHTFRGTNIVYSADVLKKHIDLHVENFPDTLILLNDDHINHGWKRGVRENMEVLNYARSLGLGLQDDSICVAGCAREFGYDTLRTPWMFDLFWKDAPVLIEFEHFHMVAPEIFKDGLPFLDALRRTHASFAGFHGYPRPWLEREPYLTGYCANRLGYWYFVNGIEVARIKNNVPNILYLWVENRGFAPGYHHFDFRIALMGTNGQVFTETIPAGNLAWRPGEEIRVPVRCTPKNVPAGDYGLFIGLFEGETPVLLGIESSRKQDGLYHLCDIPVID